MTRAMALWTVALSLIAGSAWASERINPAPSGDPMRVASDALVQAKNSCGKVTKATRLKDGMIDARCSSGDRYLVFSLNGITMTKRCTRAKALGVHDC